MGSQLQSKPGNNPLAFTVLVLLTLWLVLPLIPIAIWSLAKRWYFPDIVPREWSLQAWDYVFGVPAGRALACYKFKGKRLVELLVLAPVLVPGIAVVTGLHGIMLKLEVHNSLSGVITAHLIPALPYMILVMASTFARFDTDFEAQARTLGAGVLQTFYHVTLPALLPGIVVGAFFTFLVSWSLLLFIARFISGRSGIAELPSRL